MAFSVTTSRRRRRQLPTVQRPEPKVMPVFWYNFQNAQHWLRAHGDVISQCVQLLQIYPDLIQDSAMDRFWDFIQPLLKMEGQVDKIPDNKQRMGVPEKGRDHKRNTKIKGKEIPKISVTESRSSPAPMFTISAKHARTPRVHLISSSHVSFADSRLLHNGVLYMLLKDFYVRISTAPLNNGQSYFNNSVTNGNTFSRTSLLSESDVCVYLFDNITLEDSGCFHDWCLANTLKMPIIYIRHPRMELPQTFSDMILKHSQGCTTLNEYTRRFIHETAPLPSSSVQSRQGPSAHVVHRSSRARPCSTGDLISRGKQTRKIKRKHTEANSEVDLVLKLVQNFKTASVFDEMDLGQSTHDLKQAVFKCLGILPVDADTANNPKPKDSSVNKELLLRRYLKFHTYEASDRTNDNGAERFVEKTQAPSFLQAKKNINLLSVPDPQDLISSREWASSGSLSAPPHTRSMTTDGEVSHDAHTFFADSEVSMSSLKSMGLRATTYLVYDRKNSSHGPRRVEFPCRETDQLRPELDSDDSMGSSINFHEIDLSREVNKPQGTPESDISSSSSVFS